MNKCVLMGRLTKDPEVRFSQNTAEPFAIARYTLAVDRRGRRDAGDGAQTADFINITALGKRGEFAQKYFKKGMKVCVCGALHISTYGEGDQKKYWTEIVVEDQQFCESKNAFSGDSSGFGPPDSFYAQSASSASELDGSGFSAITESVEEEDLPF
jgi:single-strand DNA-binding protein